MTVIDHPTRTSRPTATPPPDPEPTDPAPAEPAPAEPAPVEPVAASLAVAGRVLLELDPRQLAENPHNPRTDLGDLTELSASIAETGVLEPLIVAPTDDSPGGYVVLFGHRRRAAAIAAGLATVPCDVRPDYAGRAPEQIADMLAENLHRRDLTSLEEADGYAQLSMFDGWDAARIAGRVGRPVQRVRTALAAAGLPAALRPTVISEAVTLEQAAAIEEFAGQPKAYERLMTVACQHPGGLHYALADERHKQQVTAAKAATRRTLVDAGVQVIGKPKDFPWSSVEIRLGELTGADGGLMTVAEHAACPGHAAFVDADGQPVYVCRHPKDWGHVTPPSYRHRSKAELQADAEAADARREQDQALAVAEEARASFLTDYLARTGRPPAGTLRTALQVLAFRDHGRASLRPAAGRLLNPDADQDHAAAVFTEALTKTADNRLPYLVLAYAAAAGEANLHARNAPWQFNPASAAHWLTVIEALGYPLSEVETQLRTHWSEPTDDQDDQLDGDQSEDD